MSKQQVVEEVSAKNVRAHVERIVRDIPHRAAGSTNGRRMAEYSRGRWAAAIPSGTPISVDTSAEIITSDSVSSVAIQ